MKYPEKPLSDQWFFEIRPKENTYNSAGVNRNKFAQVVVTIAIQGKPQTCDYKEVTLRTDTVEKELKTAIDTAKRIVDLLNGGSNGKPVVPETGTCAKCNGPCPEDDYLCRGCRSSTSASV